MLVHAGRRVMSMGRARDWLEQALTKTIVAGGDCSARCLIAAATFSTSSTAGYSRSICLTDRAPIVGEACVFSDYGSDTYNGSRRALALRKGRDWLGVLCGLAKHETEIGLVSSWSARRTILTSSAPPQKFPVPTFPYPATHPQEERFGSSLGESLAKAGRDVSERVLAGIQGVLVRTARVSAKANQAVEDWQFDRAAKAKMVTMEEYKRYLCSLSDGRMLTEDMRGMFRKLVGLTWQVEAPLAPWHLLFERLFPESLGYDVSLEFFTVDGYRNPDGRVDKVQGAYLLVRRQRAAGDGPVLCVVGGFDGLPAERRKDCLTKITSRIEKTVEELTAGGQTMESLPWLAFCGQDFCWGVLDVGGPLVRLGETAHVQRDTGERALLLLAEKVHGLMISQA